MTIPENGTSPENPQNAVDREIRSLFTPDAANIIATLGEGPMCVVTGPRGSGKTWILIPEIRKLLRQEGRDMLKISWGLVNNPDLLPNELAKNPNPTRGVLIVDEAGLYKKEEQKKDLLRTARDNGFPTVIPVIAYDIDTDAGERIDEDWQQAAGIVYGRPAQEIPVVHLPPKLLPVDLARRFLPARDTPQDVADYLISTVPLNLRILDHLSRQKNVPDTQEAILNRGVMWNGVIPYSQNASIGAKVFADSGLAEYYGIDKL